MRTIIIENEELDEFLVLVGRESKWGQRALTATSFYGGQSKAALASIDIAKNAQYWTNRDSSIYGTSGIVRQVSYEEMAKYPDRVYYGSNWEVKWDVLSKYPGLVLTVGQTSGTLVNDCGRPAIDIPWAGPNGSRHYL